MYKQNILNVLFTVFTPWLKTQWSTISKILWNCDFQNLYSFQQNFDIVKLNEQNFHNNNQN